MMRLQIGVLKCRGQAEIVVSLITTASETVRRPKPPVPRRVRPILVSRRG